MIKIETAETKNVNLTVDETINPLKTAIAGVERKTSYQLDAENGRRCEVIAYEKFFARTSGTMQATITVDDLKGVTRVGLIVGGGNEGAFLLNFGAKGKTESLIWDALQSYIIEGEHK